MTFDNTNFRGGNSELGSDKGDGAMVGEIVLGLLAHRNLEVLRRYSVDALILCPRFGPNLDVHRLCLRSILA